MQDFSKTLSGQNFKKKRANGCALAATACNDAHMDVSQERIAKRKTRGEEIDRRIREHALVVSQIAAEAQVTPQTVREAAKATGRVSESALGAIEAAIEGILCPPTQGDQGVHAETGTAQVARFTIEGDFGIRIVAEAPPDTHNFDDLQRAATEAVVRLQQSARRARDQKSDADHQDRQSDWED